VTPALFAALTWRRATWQGGVSSIVGGAVSTVFFELVLPRIAPGVMEAAPGAVGAAVFGADPWGIPSIYPSAIISIGLLVIVSLMTPPPTSEVLEKLFPTGAAADR
jgi:Na+/proline symporter